MAIGRLLTGELLNVGEIGVDGDTCVPVGRCILSGCIVICLLREGRSGLLEELEKGTLCEDDVGAVPIEHAYGHR